SHGRSFRSSSATIDEVNLYDTAEDCDRAHKQLEAASARAAAEAKSSGDPARGALTAERDAVKRRRDAACVTAGDACELTKQQLAIVEHRLAAQAAPSAAEPALAVPHCESE